MMMILMMIAALVGMASGVSSSLRTSVRDQLTSLAICSSDVSTSVYNSVAPALIEGFNDAWDSIAKSADLDPLTDVSIPNVDVSCSYGGSVYCGALAGSCKKSWVQMDWGYLDGLGDLEISSYSLGTISTSSSACNSDSAPSGATCIYEGNPTMIASLVSGSEVEIQLKNVKLRANCDTVAGKNSYTVVDLGTLTCTATVAEMELETTVCGSNCNIFSATVTKAKMKEISGITCKDSDVPSSLVTQVVDMLKTTIYGVIESETVKEINDEFSTLIGSGLPSDSCS